MATPNIVEGNFALVPGPNASQKWVVDDGALTGTVYQRVTGGAAIVNDGVIAEVYVTRAHAEQALDPAVRAAREAAKDRSGARWD